MSGRWVDLREAAELLGTSTEAVRKRASRDSLRSEKRDDGRVVVWVEDGRTEGGHQAQSEGDGLLVGVLREEISHLRRESERKDTIIMSLSRSNAEMSRAIRALDPAAPSGSSRPGEEAAQGSANGAGVPAPKPSRLTISEGVAITVIATAILATAKFVIPAIAAIGAFIVAGFAAINGESLVSVLSGLVGALVSALGFYQYLSAQRRLRESIAPFEYHFSEDSWAEQEGGYASFTLEIPESEHGKGNNPAVVTYLPTDDGGYAEASADVEIRPSGTVQIGSDERLSGKVVIR